MQTRVEILKKTSLFGGLDAAVLELLALRIKERVLERNELLFIAGEPADGLYVIAKGSVRAFRSGADGREQVIHVEKAVTTIAEVPVFDEGSYPSTVAAEEPSVLYFITAADIRSISASHPELALAAARLLAARLRQCAELVESLSLREVGQRIAKLMLDEAVAHGLGADGSATFAQKLTHNQLAARIGTVREVASRSIMRLQSVGLIDVQGRTVHVPDIQALRRYVDS